MDGHLFIENLGLPFVAFAYEVGSEMCRISEHVCGPRCTRHWFEATNAPAAPWTYLDVLEKLQRYYNPEMRQVAA